MENFRSTEPFRLCEYCGEKTRNVYPIMERFVYACSGHHAYKAHRQERLIERILESAAQRVREMRNVGQGLVEYALVMALVAVVVIIVLSLLGPAVGNIFSGLVSSI